MNKNDNLSNLVKLNSLDTQTTSLMEQYKQSITNYITNLKNPSKTKTTNDFSIFKNSSFWGSSAIKQTTQQDINGCTENCASDMTCTGATFEPNGGICYLRKGNGTIQSSLPLNQTAIVLNSQYNMQNTADLNSKLLDLESQKSTIVGDLKTQFDDIKSQNSQYSNSIDSHLKKLNYTKYNIGNLYNESNVLDNEYQNSYLIANSNKIIYSILFYTIILLFLGIIFKFFLK